MDKSIKVSIQTYWKIRDTAKKERRTIKETVALRFEDKENKK
jgi:hypothetical protein